MGNYDSLARWLIFMSHVIQKSQEKKNNCFSVEFLLDKPSLKLVPNTCWHMTVQDLLQAKKNPKRCIFNAHDSIHHAGQWHLRCTIFPCRV